MQWEHLDDMLAHIHAGYEPKELAMRELADELGIFAKVCDSKFCVPTEGFKLTRKWCEEKT